MDLCKHLGTWNWDARESSKAERYKLQSNINILEIVEAKNIIQGNNITKRKVNKASEIISM